MSLTSEIERLYGIKTNIRTALTLKGIAASTHDFVDFANDIRAIQTGSGESAEVTDVDVVPITTDYISYLINRNQYDEYADFTEDGELDTRDLIMCGIMLNNNQQMYVKVILTYDDNTTQTVKVAIDVPEMEHREEIPENVETMASGTYTTETTRTSALTISHLLGTIPDLVAFYTADSTAWSPTSGAPAIMAAARFVDASGMNTAGYKSFAIRRLSSGGSLAGSANPSGYGITADPTSNSFTVECSSTNPIFAGVEYKWVAIKFAS